MLRRYRAGDEGEGDNTILQPVLPHGILKGKALEQDVGQRPTVPPRSQFFFGGSAPGTGVEINMNFNPSPAWDSQGQSP